MALNRATYLEHLRRIFGRCVSLNPEEAQAMVVQATLDYVTTGTLGTQADRLEAAQIVANLFWQQILGNAYNGHRMKHWILRHGGQAANDIPNIAEPL